MFKFQASPDYMVVAGKNNNVSANYVKDLIYAPYLVVALLKFSGFSDRICLLV